MGTKSKGGSSFKDLDDMLVDCTEAVLSSCFW